MKDRKRNLWYKRISIWCTLIAMLLTILLYTSEAEALGIEFAGEMTEVINFGEMDSGSIESEMPTYGLIVRCTTGPTTGGWTLKIKIENELTHESNLASVIPNTNFRWYGVSTSDLNNTSLNIEYREEFTTYDKLVYTGDAKEDQTDITLKFELEIPRDIQWGTYDTRFGGIVFTLTEP